VNPDCEKYLHVVFWHDDALPLLLGERGKRMGGAEVQVIEIAKALSEMPNVRVSFLVKDENDTQVAFEGIGRCTLPKLIQRGLPYFGRIINRRRIENSFGTCQKTVVVRTVVTPETERSCYLIQSFGLKFVQRLSSDLDLTGERLPENSRQRYLTALKKMDGVISQSEGQQSYLQSALGIDSPVIGSGLPDLDPMIAGRKESILWAGRAAAIKQPWIFLELARRVPQQQFKMLMSYQDFELMNSLVEAAEDIPNLEIELNVSYEDTPQYFCNAHLFINTSLHEGLPVTFLQSFRASIPVFSLNVNPGDMLTEKEVGKCFKGDIELLVSELKSATSDCCKLNSAGEAGRRLFEQSYDIRWVASRWVDYLSSL